MKKFTMFIMATCFAMYGMATVNLPYTQDFAALTTGDLTNMMGQGIAASADNLVGITSVTNTWQAGGSIVIGSSTTTGELVTEEINTANYDSIRVAIKAVPYGGFMVDPAKFKVTYNGVEHEFEVPYAHAFPLSANDFTEYAIKFAAAAIGTELTITTMPIAGQITTSNRCIFDDLAISGFYSVASSCVTPTNLSATATGASSANIAWTGGSESAWNVVISTASVTDFSLETKIPVSTNSYSAAGLNPGTLYYVYVQANCGSETSEWTAATTFTTQCAAIAILPWTENFDSYGENVTPGCWTQVLFDYGYPKTFTGQQRTPPYALRFRTAQTEIIATPAFEVDVNTLNVSFYVIRNPAIMDFTGGTFEVGVMSNVLDPSTFELIQDATPTALRTYVQFTVSLANATPGSHHIAFRLKDPVGSYPENDYYAIDDVEVTVSTGGPIPPTVVTWPVITYTTTTATLRKTVTPGTEPILSEGFEYQVTGSGSWAAAPSTGNLVGLTPNTSYDYYAFATTTTGTYYGDTLDFTTLSDIVPPTVTTLEANPVGQTTATLNKAVVSGSEVISAEGFEYQVTGSGSWTDAPSDGNLVGLTSNTSYDFYAFATTATGTYYGDTLNFTTQAEGAGYDTANTNEFIIYPNPTNSTATVKVEGLNTSAKVTVTDINGKLIETRTISAGNDTTELDVASYTDGTYLVRVVADGINRVEKLIVKK